eukprot:symbB.v1.2.019939.t1/scaffold1645.1/size107836/4
MALAGSVDMLSWTRLYWGWLLDVRLPWKHADDALLRLPEAFAAIPPIDKDVHIKGPSDEVQDLLKNAADQGSSVLVELRELCYHLGAEGEPLPNGNFRVGVHIADVTHFVHPDTAIDREAAERCTTVYLVERRTDMLPGLLTTDICSLRGKVERLTFTVLWEMTPAAEIVDTSFCKAIIKSREALSYGEAQARIDDPKDQSEITTSLRNLLKLTRQIRGRRVAKGALELASQEVRFELDSETQDPTDVAEYQQRETNKLIEELLGDVDMKGSGAVH